MPTIRKICVLVTLSFLSLSSLAAETGRYSLRLSPLTGVLIGKSEEFLYKYKKQEQFLSHLQWDLKPLVYFGLGLDFGPKEPFERGGFISEASVKFGLPLKTGIMEDKDWLNAGDNELTNYSRHDAYSQNAILIDVFAGYSWHITDFLALRAFAEFSYMYLSWMAEDGYYEYASNNWKRISIFGAGIRYTQNWFIAAPGISAVFKIHRVFSIEGSFRYSPLAFCADSDDHFFLLSNNTARYYYGTFYYGNYINAGLNLCLTPKENLDLSLSAAYRDIRGLRDKTYYASTGPGVSGTSNVSPYEGGAGYSAFDIKLAVKIRIYGR